MRLLDPGLTEDATDHPNPPGQLPPRVRQFGFVPSFELLRPGDLLLVSQVRAPWLSKAIRVVQEQAGFVEPHSQWHHAAIWVGRGLVCEAVRGGVRTRSIHDYGAGTHRLRFRRDTELDELQGALLALEAALKIRYRYDSLAVLRLLLQAHTGWGRINGNAPRPISLRATICSQLYADAHGVVTRRTLVPEAISGVTPAHLSATRELRDINMHWYRIDPNQVGEIRPTRLGDPGS